MLYTTRQHALRTQRAVVKGMPGHESKTRLHISHTTPHPHINTHSRSLLRPCLENREWGSDRHDRPPRANGPFRQRRPTPSGMRWRARQLGQAPRLVGVLHFIQWTDRMIRGTADPNRGGAHGGPCSVYSGSGELSRETLDDLVTLRLYGDIHRVMADGHGYETSRWSMNQVKYFSN